MIRFDVRALESFTQTHEIVLRLPDTLAIIGGTPGDFTVIQDTPPDLTASYDVTWFAGLTEGITQTFALNILPTVATDGPLYDVVQGYVHFAGLGRYDGSSESVWLRVGNASQPGAVATEWPNAFTFLSGGYRGPHAKAGPVVAEVDGGMPIPVPTVSTEDLPPTEPLAVDLQIDEIVDADTPVAMVLTVRNTVTSTVSYAGALTLPAEWAVLAGPAALDAVLAPGQDVSFNFQVLPRIIPCTWTIEGRQS